MTAPYCARCSVGDAIHTRGPDHLCAACAEDWDGASLSELADGLACVMAREIVDPSDALRIICATPWYDVWCCWAAIMRSRKALASAPQPDAIRGDDGDTYTAADLKELLDDRDAFIVSKDLWIEYARRAGSFASAPQPACVGVGEGQK